MVSELTRVERAYLEIKHRIVHGALPPGEPLSESRLARVLHTSRTPVREALTRLREEGYVERVPARGFFVGAVSVRLIQDVFEVRRLLEGAAAARAAELATPEAIRQLRAVAAFQYTPGNAASFRQAVDANAEFHIWIARASGNAIFLDMVRHCLDQVTRLLALGVDSEPLQASASCEHHAVVNAIARHDAQGARRAMEKHLDGSSQRILETLLKGGVRAVTV
jgi:DNA-binding GntR family transcriptional regulator